MKTHVLDVELDERTRDHEHLVDGLVDDVRHDGLDTRPHAPHLRTNMRSETCAVRHAQ